MPSTLSSPSPPERRFALDQNFPRQLVNLPWPAGLSLVPLATAEPDLVAAHDDREVLLELERGGGYAGLVTNVSGMLELAAEMVLLARTNLLLVVTEQVGHNPIRATGLVMVHLEQIAREGRRGEIYRVRPGGVRRTSANERVNVIARRQNLTPRELIRREIEAMNAVLRARDKAPLW